MKDSGTESVGDTIGATEDAKWFGSGVRPQGAQHKLYMSLRNRLTRRGRGLATLSKIIGACGSCWGDKDVSVWFCATNSFTCGFSDGIGGELASSSLVT
jgi:hypothetical protein